MTINFYLACQQAQQEEYMLQNYFKKITLYTIAAFVCFIAFIIVAISRQPEEIKSPVLFKLILATLLFFVFDILLKQILKLKKGWLWTIQFFLLLVAVYIWIIS